MKKTVTLLLILSMIMVLASCGKKDDTGTDAETTKAAEVTKEAEITEAPETTKEAEVTNAPEVTSEPEATPDATETPEPTPEQIDDLDFSKLIGHWSEDNATYENTLAVNDDGSIELVYLGNTQLGSIITYKDENSGICYGIKDNNGNIIGKIIPEEIMDNFVTVYSPVAGEFYFSRVNPDTNVSTDNQEDEYDGDGYPIYTPGDEFTGTWQCDRASMTVMREGAAAFVFEIIWANSASEWVKWNYWTFYNEEAGAFSNEGDGVMWNYTYDPETGETIEELLSLEESADFVVDTENDCIYWIDNSGNIEDTLCFERIPVED